MLKRAFSWLLLGALLSGGCAGVAEFKLPGEFRDGKLVEDPPGAALPYTWSQPSC